MQEHSNIWLSLSMASLMPKTYVLLWGSPFWTGQGEGWTALVGWVGAQQPLVREKGRRRPSIGLVLGWVWSTSSPFGFLRTENPYNVYFPFLLPVDPNGIRLPILSHLWVSILLIQADWSCFSSVGLRASPSLLSILVKLGAFPMTYSPWWALPVPLSSNCWGLQFNQVRVRKCTDLNTHSYQGWSGRMALSVRYKVALLESIAVIWI
jgi:hypothetical protein